MLRANSVGTASSRVRANNVGARQDNAAVLNALTQNMAGIQRLLQIQSSRMDEQSVVNDSLGQALVNLPLSIGASMCTTQTSSIPQSAPNPKEYRESVVTLQFFQTPGRTKGNHD